MLRDYEAARELERVRNLSAFNVSGAIERRKLNQFASLYRFADGSTLRVRARSSAGDCWHRDWRGTAQDVALGPLQGVPLRINR